jgi:PQQ-dependent catabolism-associated CXXCW motif protein
VALYAGGGVIATVVVLGIIGSIVGPQPATPPVTPPPQAEERRPPPVAQDGRQTPPPSGGGQQGGTQQPAAQAEFANELRDFGVPAQAGLQANVGGPTPTSVPGARTVATAALVAEWNSGNRDQFLLIDVRGGAGHQSIPGARHLPDAGVPGTLDDGAQRRLEQDLERLTNGRRAFPLVFFCSGVNCWLSYNASLRARAAGFTNVFWYRGGLDAWRAAGQPMGALAP